MFNDLASASQRPKPNRQAICVARVLCIGGLILIHIAPYGNPRSFEPAGAGVQLAYAYVIQILARASVPLLSIVSGFLLASSFASAASWRSAAARRVRSLLTPLILWNAIGLVWSRLAASEPWPGDLAAWLDTLVGLTHFPVVDPLHFLRDLYLCVLAAPLLAWSVKKIGWWSPAALLVLCVFGLQRPIILSDSILPFFTAGLGLGLGLLKAKTPAAWIVVAAGLCAPAVTAMLEVAASKNAGPILDALAQVMPFVQRICGAALFWLAARSLATSRLGKALARIEPVAFLVFCSHTFVIAVCWALYKLLGVTLLSPAFIVFAALMPVICFVAAFIIAALGRRFAPLPLAILTGGKASVAPPAQQPA